MKQQSVDAKKRDAAGWVMGICLSIILVFLVSACGGGGGDGGSIPPLPPTPPNPPGPVEPPLESGTQNALGLNTWFLNDWDDSFAFVDAMQHARIWKDANWEANLSSAQLDAKAWPNVDASTVILAGAPVRLNGSYKLVFNGQANLSPIFGAQATISNQQYNAATNTTTADVTYNLPPDSPVPYVGFYFTNSRKTASSATNTGFSNVHLYRSGYPTDGSAVFRNEFLNAMAKGSVIRMMDWTNTNLNLTSRWQDRRTPLHSNFVSPSLTIGSYHWDGSTNNGELFSVGISLEHQIQLCNAANKDCWINIPIAANDGYIAKMALALRYGTNGTEPYTSIQANPVYPPLKSGLRLYLEYGNEIWNSGGGFFCFDIVRELTKALPSNHPINTYLPTENEYFKMWRYPAWRMMFISDAFRAVYGDAAMMTLVRPLLMAQIGNGNNSLAEPLVWMDNYLKALSPRRAINSYFYGAGGAAYYTVNTEPANKSDLNAFFASSNYPAKEAVMWMGQDAVWAANYGLKRIAYEGGPNLDNFDNVQSRAINADPRITDMIVRTHDAWSAQGGDLLVYYAAVGPARWEFTPDITNLNTPKYRALDQLNTRARAKVTLGQALPGNIIAQGSDYLPMYSPPGEYRYDLACDSVPEGCIANNTAGSWIAVAGHADNAFAGSIHVRGVADEATTFNVFVNGVLQGQVTMAKTTNDSVTALSTALPAPIPKGLVVIRLEVVSGRYRLRSVEVGG